MAAPTSLAKAFNKSLANGEPSTHGTGLTLAVLLHRRDERTFIRSAQRYTLALSGLSESSVPSK
jgi:hypothetical protein